jgi:hypothetical protein
VQGELLGLAIIEADCHHERALASEESAVEKRTQVLSLHYRDCSRNLYTGITDDITAERDPA